MEEVEHDIQDLTGIQTAIEGTTGAKLGELDDPMEEETEEDPFLAAFDFDYGEEENSEAYRKAYNDFKAKFWSSHLPDPK